MFERRGTLSGMGFSATERVHTAYVVWVDSGCSMCRSGVSYARNTIESKAAEMPRKRSTAAHGYHGGGGVLWCRKRRYHTPQYRQESKAREPRKGVQRRMIIMEAAGCGGAAKGDIIRRSTGKRVRRRRCRAKGVQRRMIIMEAAGCSWRRKKRYHTPQYRRESKAARCRTKG